MLNMVRIILALAIAVTCTVAYAQNVPLPKTNSPYSRFGVGDLNTLAYSAQLGMGGIGIAFSDPHIASPTNPASLAALRYTSYQVGVGLERSVLSDNVNETTNLDGNLQYLSLAFALKNQLNEVLDGSVSKYRHAMMLSLTPYSNVGYNVETTTVEPGFGQVINRFRGSGGYYRLQFGNGFEYKRFRAGVNLSYIFGRTNNQQQIFGADADGFDIGFSRVTDTDALRARGVEVQLGGQYDIILASGDNGPTKVLTIGATGNLGTNLNGEASRVITTANRFQGTRVDTALFQTSESQTVELPSKFGVGVFYRHRNKFSGGVDFTRIGWDNYSNTLRPNERLESATNVAVGIEWIPNYQSFGKYWNRVSYRLGAYAHQDPRSGIDAETGFSVGFGLPIIRPREEISYVNLSLNAGNFGTAGDISQRYVRLVVGFTLTDNTWFYKRRFN